MKPNIKQFVTLFKSAFMEWLDKDPFRQSAVIAYYAIFSLPGLLVLIINIAGYFFGTGPVNQSILEQITATMGPVTASQIETLLINASRPESSLWSTMVGIVIMLVGATGVFVELQKSLNMIWQVKAAVPQKKILALIRARLFSFGLILAIAFLLLISLVISTALAAMSNWVVSDTSSIMLFTLKVLNSIFSLAIISALFALIYKILPDAKIKWEHVWLGALVTALLFTAGKAALAFYFGKAEPGADYGAAGSIVLVMLWVSYSSMIVFLGAEFTAQYARMFAPKVPPTELAVAEEPGESDKKK